MGSAEAVVVLVGAEAVVVLVGAEAVVVQVGAEAVVVYGKSAPIEGDAGSRDMGGSPVSPSGAW